MAKHSIVVGLRLFPVLQLVGLLALNYFLSSNLLIPFTGVRCQLYQMHTPSYFCLFQYFR